MGGANDGGSFKKTTNNLETIYKLAKSNDAKVVAMTIVPGDEKSNNFRMQVNEWIKKNNNIDAYVDTYDYIYKKFYTNPDYNPHYSQSYTYIANEVKQSYFS